MNERADQTKEDEDGWMNGRMGERSKFVRVSAEARNLKAENVD